jgi:hypothetical protein
MGELFLRFLGFNVSSRRALPAPGQLVGDEKNRRQHRDGDQAEQGMVTAVAKSGLQIISPLWIGAAGCRLSLKLSGLFWV